MSIGNSVTILLVEDDEIDAEAVQRAFRKQKIASPVLVAGDGQQAVDMLRGTNGVEKIARPHLILLDLNMPRMDGLEFLTEMRRDPSIADSIVFILTTSDLDEDKVAAYGHHVAGYMVKNKLEDSFSCLAHMVDSYRRVIEFPPAA
jgi:CheY-like chemotaxis protein